MLKCLCRGEVACPWQGAKLSKQLQIALCGFCSLKAFCAALEDENENSSLPISGPGTEPGDPLLCVPSQKSSRSLLSPRSPATLHAHPACDRAFLTLVHGPVWSLPTQQIPAALYRFRRRKVSLPGFAICGVPAQKVVAQMSPRSQFKVTLSWKPTIQVHLCIRFPPSNTWELRCTQTPSVLLRPWGTENTLSPSRLHPSLASGVTSLSIADF